MADNATIEFNEPKRSGMLDRLWKLQNTVGYVTDEAIKQIADEYNISTIEVEGVVSFYHFFHRKCFKKPRCLCG